MPASDHESFRQARNPAAKIWRYMDRFKFEWMLSAGALYFRRADAFSDPLEGHYTAANPAFEDRWVAHQKANSGFGIVCSEPELREGYRKMLNVVSDDKARTFVNCWHMNERETSAMWQGYGAHTEAVCIQSTFELMKNHLPSECFFGGVTYMDYKTDVIDPLNSLNFINHKDKAYAHEREVRAVIWGKEATTAFSPLDAFGLKVPIDLALVITEIRVGPTAPPGYEHTIEALARSCKIQAPVVRSAIAPTGP